MSFAFALALAVGLFVAAPYAAHLLRRKHAEERPFPPARLVPATPPEARRRSALEDRALFAVRAASVVALAVLGATPFVNCSHLTLDRQAGASIAMAIVIDDSLSMRAPMPDGTPRFERAREAALELLDSTRTGDAIAVVMAGAPARVLLATTTNASAAREALRAVKPSDRAADLDGALGLGRDLVGTMPHADKRIVLLSDLTDGSGESDPLLGSEAITLWAPLNDELAPTGADCGVVSADRRGQRVDVRLRCARAPAADGGATESPSSGRKLEIAAGDKTLASVDLAAELKDDVISLDIPADAPDELFAVLTGSDLLAEDDVSAVIEHGRDVAVAVVADATTSKLDTGGPPPVEQALAALGLGVAVRPLPATPDGKDDLQPFAALIVDDAPGFTPEARRAMKQWVEEGGLLLLTFGPRAAAAPLGSSFDPLVRGVVRWTEETPAGITPGSASLLGPAAESLHDFAPKGRTLFDGAALPEAEVAARWSDDKPLLLRERMGRGAVWSLGAPMSIEQSDLVLRPAFLAMLERFVAAAQAAGGPHRLEAGERWTFDGYDQVRSQFVARPGQEAEPVTLQEEDGHPTLVADRIGLYRLELDATQALRAANVPEREIDLQPRGLGAPGEAKATGGVAARIDASPYVALVLLGLLLVELSLRARARAAEPAPPPVPQGEGAGG